MRRIRTIQSLAGILAMLAGLLVPVVASATPTPNSAVIIQRVFDDCPASTVSPVNNYPVSVSVTDQGSNCFGFANLHVWRFSQDGTNPTIYNNTDPFAFAADLVISGTGEGEAGLQIRPWWGEADGRMNVRTTDGEIACFGGRLPFYTFSAPGPHGPALHYVKGTTIHLEMNYLPNSLGACPDCPDPEVCDGAATVEYKLRIDGTDYSSGPLKFNRGNCDEDPPYGLWGILNGAGAGGHVQVLWQASGPNTTLRAEWSNITFNETKVAAQPAAWSAVKSMYRK